MPSSVFDPYKIEMIDFMLLKGEVDNSFAHSPENYEWDHSTDFELSYLWEQKHVRIDFRVILEAFSEEVSELIAKANYLYSVIYKVDNLEELVKRDEERMEANPALIISLLAITYSTIRGALITRLQGTALSGVILPIIDPAELLKES